jgi:hypothetical protein
MSIQEESPAWLRARSPRGVLRAGRRRFLCAALLALLCLGVAHGTAQAQGVTRLCLESVGANGSNNCVDISSVNPLPVGPNAYPANSTAITGNAAGTTGAVVGTLAGTAAKTTYICGFNVQAIGGTAPVGPITIAGLIGSSQVYQGSSSAAGGTVASGAFEPCIPASATNTAITVTTTAAAGATAVDVNAWGYQQ